MTLLQAKTSSNTTAGGSTPLRHNNAYGAKRSPRKSRVEIAQQLVGTGKVAHRFLVASNNHDWVKVITGTELSPHRSWQTEFRPWTLEQVADAIANADQRAIGMKPEGKIRWIVIDIDSKPGSKSPYWDQRGQNLYLQALDHVAEAAGCRVVTVRSSNSKGLHKWILLPELAPAHVAHHIGKELVARAGMTVKDGTCEIFPSELRYRKGCPPASKGVRLPGGKGSALLVGDQFIDDPQSIWEELLNELECTEATPAWDALVSDAEARVQSQFKLSPRRNGSYGNRTTAMPEPWTGKHQSMAIVERLTRIADAELAGCMDQVVVARAIQLIQNHPGFEQHASVVTKRRVRNGSWPQQWLDVWTRKGQRQAEDAPDRVRDPEHNDRLRGETLEKIQAAIKVHGEALLELSERAAAALLKVTRDTWRKVRSVAQNLLRSEVVDTPPIKALDRQEAESASGCSCSEDSIEAVSISPAPSAEEATVGVNGLSELKPEQNGFSFEIRSNLSALRETCSGLFKPNHAKTTPLERGTRKEPGEDQSDELHGDGHAPARSRLDLAPEAKRSRELSELEAWINSG